jgi:NAD(P)-dependent dehydrogenase (short-subunit alcohol dehydrogenase family)
MPPLSPGAVITGIGGGGIGTAIATSLKEAGYSVFSIERTEESKNRAQVLLDIPPERIVVGDVAKESSHIQLKERVLSLGVTPTILVHNAARGQPYKSVEDTSIDEFLTDINDIVIGAFQLVRAFSSILPNGGRSRIVFISSSAALRGTFGRGVSYASAKAALHGMTKQLALQLADRAVTVNCVVPFQTLTPRVLRGGRRTEHTIIETAKQNVPLQRPGRPEDISNLVKFIASAGSEYITGQIFEVDGGQTLAPLLKER